LSPSGGIAAFDSDQKREDGVARPGASQFGGEIAVAKGTACACQSLEVFGACIRRRQDDEHQVDRHPVDRLKVDRRREAGEIADDALQSRNLAMRDRRAAAEAGRADLLALAEAGDDRLRRKVDAAADRGAELLEQPLLVGGGQMLVNRVDRQDVG
jgi:hypothetical protein